LFGLQKVVIKSCPAALGYCTSSVAHTRCDLNKNEVRYMQNVVSLSFFDVCEPP